MTEYDDEFRSFYALDDLITLQNNLPRDSFFFASGRNSYVFLLTKLGQIAFLMKVNITAKEIKR